MTEILNYEIKIKERKFKSLRLQNAITLISEAHKNQLVKIKNTTAFAKKATEILNMTAKKNGHKQDYYISQGYLPVNCFEEFKYTSNQYMVDMVLPRQNAQE